MVISGCPVTGGVRVVLTISRWDMVSVVEEQGGHEAAVHVCRLGSDNERLPRGALTGNSREHYGSLQWQYRSASPTTSKSVNEPVVCFPQNTN